MLLYEYQIRDHIDRLTEYAANVRAKFDADAKKYLAAVDRAIIEQQRDHYPLASCPVSHEPLDAMGGPVDLVYNNRLVRFCCNGCVRQFNKNPAKFLATLNEAVIEQQMADYPLATCPISNQGLNSMGGAVDMIIANRLVRFCCAGCTNAFYKAPAVHLANLEKAWKHDG